MTTRKKRTDESRFAQCPHCGTAFDPAAAIRYRGTILCPNCGEDLTEPISDEVAQAITQYRASKKRIDAEQQKIDHMAERASSGFLSRIWADLYRNKAELAQKDLRRQKALADEVWPVIWDEAESLYARNPWFLSSHCPLTDMIEDNELAIAFLDNDLDALCRAIDDDDIEGGNLGEFIVHEELRRLAQDKDSPLYQAQIVSNLNVPTSFDENRGVPNCSQVDLVLLTRSNAFVIEVKATASTMAVNEEFSTVRKIAEEGSAGRKNRPPSKALGQNKRQAKSFRRICPHYPADRVHEVVLFVGPHTFKGGKNEFKNNRFVGSLPQGRADLRHALEQAVRQEKPVMDQDSVYLLADLLQSKHGMS